MTRRLLASAAMIATLLASACGSGTSTSPSSTTSTPSTELFYGTASPSGSAFYSFTVARAGALSVTLESTAAAKVGPALTVPLSMGLGTPSGFGCATTSTVDTAAGLTAQITNASLAAGTYCINVADSGRLASDTLFVIRIIHT